MPTPPTLPDLTLLRRIGGGSYGDVWIARTLTGIYRAVKIVDRARFPDERPFLRELDGITRFQQSVGDQPRQLALLHVGRLEEDGILYYSMELADDVEAGTEIDPERYTPLTLKALHERRPVMPAADCVRIGIDLARALAGLHGAGLIHRDVKPSNIIFVAGVPKLADIGLVSSSDHTLTSLGTPGYSPPEGSGTVRADIYSLGKILYELATGLPGRDFPRLPPDLEQREDAAQLLELNEVVLRACEADPNLRYASAQAMLDDLLLIQAGKSVKELLRARQLVKTLRRMGTMVAVVALVVITILAVKNYYAARALAAQETAARQQAERDERLARYTADLHLAQLTLASGDLGLARAALRRQIPKQGEPDLRGLEWYALWNETAGDDERAIGDIGGPPVRALALSPDGNLLATQEGETNRTTVVWDLRTGARRDLARGTNGLGGFTADGARLIVGTQDRHVRLVDVTTGAAGPVQSATGRLVAHAGDRRTVVLGAAVNGVVQLRLWDTVAQSEVAAWQSPADFVPAQLQAAAVSGDRRMLAVVLYRARGMAFDQHLEIWDLSSGRMRARRTDFGPVFALHFSPDGNRLACGGPDRPIELLDTSNGQTVQTLAGQKGKITAFAFSADGSRLASVGEDQTLRVWLVGQDMPVAVLRGHEGAVQSVAWLDGDARLITAGDDGTARLWHPTPVRSARERGGLSRELFGDLVFATDSATMFATDAEGLISEIDARTLDSRGRTLDAFRPVAMAGTRLLALNRALELLVLDPTSDEVSRPGLQITDAARLAALGASRDGRFIAIGLTDGTVEFWDTQLVRALPREKHHESQLLALAVAPDGKLAASGDLGGVVWLWEPSSGNAKMSLPPENSAIGALAYSPDSTVLVVGRGDGSVQIVDAASGRVSARWQAHTREVYTATVSADGQRLVTGGSDGLVIVWSLPDHRQLAVFSLLETGSVGGDRRPRRVRLSPDGSQLLVLISDGSLRRWTLTPPPAQR